ncbi:hypothetical protein ITP53_27390 [Nonomuraea sp. K274]|uniref:Uncharacterized protein n=1 Tax=Nonomuraea cypriaca TaxID=1187855 RepID=A0A931AHT3_9ACTN|nr:hypothetical protein [Nonomuraea cypriaca]MBF8189392.1 hypothetical protein [Nonomuraea cypriaca]
MLISVIAAVAVVVLGGGAYGAYAYLSAPGPAPNITMPTVSSIPPQSDPPSSLPTESPESEPSPTDSPSTSNRTEPGSPLAHTEFKDWNFGLGDVKFDAKKVGGWTYDSCDPVDGEGVLADNECESAVQVAYSADDGAIKAAQIMMSFPSEQTAKTTASRLAKLTSDAVLWRQSTTHSTYAYGKIRSGSAKNYVVVTVVTATKAASSKAPKFHSFLQADHANYFLMRDLRVPS